MDELVCMEKDCFETGIPIDAEVCPRCGSHRLRGLDDDYELSPDEEDGEHCRIAAFYCA